MHLVFNPLAAGNMLFANRIRLTNKGQKDQLKKYFLHDRVISYTYYSFTVFK